MSKDKETMVLVRQMLRDQYEQFDEACNVCLPFSNIDEKIVCPKCEEESPAIAWHFEDDTSYWYCWICAESVYRGWCVDCLPKKPNLKMKCSSQDDWGDFCRRKKDFRRRRAYYLIYDEPICGYCRRDKPVNWWKVDNE